MSEGKDRSAAEIESDIARTRVELGDTVAALSAKLDVKSRARARASAFATEVKATAQTRQAQVVAGVLAVVAVLLVVRKVRR